MQRLFEAACELAAEEREAYLRRACRGDEALRREVEELLALDTELDEPGSVMVSSAAGKADDSTRMLLERVATHTPSETRYKVLGELARGGMGAILRVWDEDLRRHLAMKVVLRARGGEAGDSADRVKLARFLEEAQVTGQLDHPGVVPVHELGLDATGRAYFTMKLVKGQTLKQVFELMELELGGWTRTRVLGVLLKVCEAMAYAHAKHVIHRDLKPANVMVGRFGEVYVMDWGLAKILGQDDERDIRVREQAPGSTSELRTERHDHAGETPDSPLYTMDGDVVGTPAYMSPEQARGRVAEMGPASDVYALGAMLYHLLAGHMPYVPPGARLNNYAVWQRVQEGPPRPLDEEASDAPAELVAICERAMAREPAERYPDVSALAEDLRAYLEGRVVSAYRTGAWAEARTWMRRNRPLALALAGAAVALVGGVVASSLFALDASEQEALADRRAREAQRLALSEADARRAAVENAAARERVAAGLAARALVAELDELELTPEGLPALRTWRARVEGLLEKSSALEQELGGLPEDARRAAEIRETLEDLTHLRAALPRVAAWEDVVASLQPRLTGEDAEAWGRARRAIADSPHYAGLDLSPQVGLAPLREDPWSGLWEFWHVVSGERPEVDPDKDDRYLLRPESGIVLVLLPGGTFDAGDDSGRLGYIEKFEDAPVPPLYVSKFEVTQGQWQRITGRNPSMFSAGLTMPAKVRVSSEPRPFTAVHPVEQVSWLDAERFCRRIGLELPHEIYWEYACRAETTTDWCWGDALANLEDKENVRDEEARRQFEPGAGGFVWWNDGHPVHAPVGSFEPNAFGLFDVHGNVSEWCGNALEGDWLADGMERRQLRGGSWERPADPFSMSAYRFNKSPREASSYVGLRACRALEP